MAQKGGARAEVDRLRDAAKTHDASLFDLKARLEVSDAELRRVRLELEEAAEAKRFFEDELAAARRDRPAAARERPSEADDFAPVFAVGAGVFCSTVEGFLSYGSSIKRLLSDGAPHRPPSRSSRRRPGGCGPRSRGCGPRGPPGASRTC